MCRIDLAHGWRSSLVAGTRYVSARGSTRTSRNWNRLGRTIFEPVLLLSGQEFTGSLHVLPQHRHLFLDLLDPHLGFFLEFLEERGLNQLGLLSEQLP